MKSSTKILIGIIVVALVGAGVYFGGGTDLFKGSLQETNKNITKAQLAELIVTTLSPVIPPDEISNLSEACAPDIAGMPEATSICYLINKGKFSTFADGSFKPNNTVTRAEGAKLFMSVFPLYMGPGSTEGTNAETPSVYTDVEVTAWYKSSINALASWGISDIKPGNKFYPNNPLTNGRAQYWIKKIKEKSAIL